jgi:hypothetical protein
MIVCVFSINCTIVKAQCAPEEYSMNCIENIREGFIYLKSYNIDGKKGIANKVEHTTIFSKDVKYVLNICTGSTDADGIILTIYNAGRETMASTVGEDGISSELEFNCNKTGIYYLTFTFQDSRSSCGGCILSFKK